MLQDDEADLAKIKARMVEMEAEAAKLKAMQEKQKEAFDAGEFMTSVVCSCSGELIVALVSSL